MIISEEVNRDNVGNYVVLERPLEISHVVFADDTKTVFTPWILGEDTHHRIVQEHILAHNPATLEHKIQYSKYFLSKQLAKIISPAELQSLIPSDDSSVLAKAPVKNVLIPQYSTKVSTEIPSASSLLNSISTSARFEWN